MHSGLANVGVRLRLTSTYELGAGPRCAELKPLQQSKVVISAQAGIPWALAIAGRWMRRLDFRLRGNDEIIGLCLLKHWG